MPSQGNSSLRLVLLGGLIAGALDILFAISFWAWKANVPPERILQSVASGLLGRASFTGGWQTAVLGFGLHFFIAISMAAAWYVVVRQRPFLQRRPLLYGLMYGLILYLMMNYIVVPLSAAAPGSRDALWVTLSVLVHMMLIGVPIAFFAGRAAQASRS